MRTRLAKIARGLLKRLFPSAVDAWQLQVERTQQLQDLLGKLREEQKATWLLMGKVNREQEKTRARVLQIHRTLSDSAPGPKVRRKAHGTEFASEPLPVLLASDSDETTDTAVQAELASEIMTLDGCPVCGSTAWSDVCEYNKFLLLERGPDRAARVYNYALCHACEIVFARRRPYGDRFADLLERFEASLGRVGAGETMKGRVGLNSARLTPESREDILRGAAMGVFVSDHQTHPGDGRLAVLLRDRMANSVHIELLTSLLALERPRVLELRPRFGAIGAGLKRSWAADVYGLPLFEGQQLLNRAVYGHRVDHRLDYDHFAIPYEGTFDLVVANHMMTHALRPGEFLQTVHDRLAPHGHLYLYNEPDDAEILGLGQSMFGWFNPFHFQAFDRESLLRGLRSAGFEPTFVTSHQGNLVVLAVRTERPEHVEPMSDTECSARIGKYRTARDLAILRLPPHLRPAFSDEWDVVVERVYTAGLAEFTAEGKLRLRRETDARHDDTSI